MVPSPKSRPVKNIQARLPSFLKYSFSWGPMRPVLASQSICCSLSAIHTGGVILRQLRAPLSISCLVHPVSLENMALASTKAPAPFRQHQILITDLSRLEFFAAEANHVEKSIIGPGNAAHKVEEERRQPLASRGGGAAASPPPPAYAR
jgi:hypothetical protein